MEHNSGNLIHGSEKKSPTDIYRTNSSLSTNNSDKIPSDNNLFSFEKSEKQLSNAGLEKALNNFCNNYTGINYFNF